MLPVATVSAVTGISRASALVPDIRSGYLGRLLVSPVSRFSLLLGLMVADLALVIALSMPVLVLGFILGVGFATGPRACSRSCSSALVGPRVHRFSVHDRAAHRQPGR